MGLGWFAFSLYKLARNGGRLVSGVGGLVGLSWLVLGSCEVGMKPNRLVILLCRFVSSEEGSCLSSSCTTAPAEDVVNKGGLGRGGSGLPDADADEGAGSRRSEAGSDSSRVSVKTIDVVVLLALESEEVPRVKEAVMKLG